MRKYALVIFDGKDEIIDRFNLDIITNPTGNGFKLNLSKISSDIEDIITKVVQQKNVITFTVHQINHSYSKSNVLTNWIQKYSTSKHKMALEYDDGVNDKRYCEGRVTTIGKTEIEDFKDLALTFEFTQTTPFFIYKKNTINIQVSNEGKSYPYRYPYNYGTSQILNNEIDNIYILNIPLIIIIDGAITNPTIDLLDENNNRYSRVRLEGITIATGEQLIINSAQRKIYKIDTNGTQIDYVTEVSPSFDTFLQAQPGKTKISINTNDSAEGFKLTGSWRQYTL